MLDRLLEEHRQIRELADQLESIIERGLPEDATLFWRLRWRLLAQIFRNLRHEKVIVTEPLLRDPRPEVVQLVERFQVELEEITSRYLDHIVRWDSDESIVDWSIYGDQVRSLTAVLRDRMEREEHVLYPLIWPQAAGL